MWKYAEKSERYYFYSGILCAFIQGFIYGTTPIILGKGSAELAKNQDNPDKIVDVISDLS